MPDFQSHPGFSTTVISPNSSSKSPLRELTVIHPKNQDNMFVRKQYGRWQSERVGFLSIFKSSISVCVYACKYVYMDIYGYIWIYMDIYGYVCICINTIKAVKDSHAKLRHLM